MMSADEQLDPIRLDGSSEPAGAPPPRSPGPWKWIAGALALLLVGLGLYYVGQSGWFRSDPAPAPTPVVSTPTPVPTEDPELRRQAEAALQRWVEASLPLRNAGVEWWGGEPWEEIMEQIGVADEEMGNREYVPAAQRYLDQVDALDPLLDRLPDLAEWSWPDVLEAYAAGKQEEAVGRLEGILSVDPDHAEARDLLPRAEVSATSRRHLDRATEHAESEHWDLAWAELQRLSQVDDAFPGAAELRERVSAGLAREELAQWLARAYEALEAGRDSDALDYLERAEAFARDHPAVQSLRADMDDRARQREVMELRLEAEQFERGEEWREAYKTWLRISALDTDTPWVKDGLERALTWSVWEEKIERAEANPESRQTAEWVSEMRNREQWPPALERRAASLVSAWDLRQQPVRVTMRSDMETEVSVQRVTNWERFREKELELKPGDYVARGRRRGYRDVRVSFTLEPGQEGKDVEVICTEAL